MRKYKLYTLSLITCLGLLFGGCGSDKDSVSDTADTFLQAAMDCDLETVSQYCAENVLTDIGLNALSPEYAESIIYTNLQIEKDSLSETSKQAVSEFCNYYSGQIIQNYTLGEITVENNIATLNATVTTHNLDSISTDAFHEDLNQLMTKYQDEHMEELISVNLTDGNDAMMNKLFDDLMPDIMAVMKKSYDSYPSEEVTIEFTFEKTDDKWLITKAFLLQ